MAGMNSIPQLTAEQKNFLLSKSPFVLPDNPSDKHFSPAQIKRKMYEGLVVLYDYINQLISAINADITLSNADVTQINNDLTTIYGYFVGGIAKKATADASGNVITSTYETIADYAEKRATDQADYTGKYNANKDEIDKIKDGTTVVEKANKDADGNVIKSTYANSLTHSLQGSATTLILKIAIKNKVNETLSEFSQTIGSATEQTAGLLTASDKARLNAVTDDIATALTQAKAYADALVIRSNLVSILGEASTSQNGLLSAEDKRRLNVLYSLLGESEDADEIVNTINEVLAIFDEYPEGADLVGRLALKINYSDIIDDLLTQNSNKPLSANQGYILKGLIDSEATTRGAEITKFLDGTYTAKKAERDSEGNVIKDTYFNHEEGFAVGLVSVDDYNSSTGEVTLRYNSDAISDVTYNSSTGEVTFTY